MVYIFDGLWMGYRVEVLRLGVDESYVSEFQATLLSKLKRKMTPQNGDIIIRNDSVDFEFIVSGEEGGKLFLLLNMPSVEWTQERIRDRYIEDIDGSLLGFSE